MRPTSRRSCVGFVSHMFFHCHEMRLHCFLLSVAWFQLALISSHCFESFLWLDRLPRSFACGSSMEKALNLRLFTKLFLIILSGVVALWGHDKPKKPGSNPAEDLLFPFFLFFFFFVLSCLLICFAVFFVLFLNIYLNNCY